MGLGGRMLDALGPPVVVGNRADQPPHFRLALCLGDALADQVFAFPVVSHFRLRLGLRLACPAPCPTMPARP